jgi:hypothetical protein
MKTIKNAMIMLIIIIIDILIIYYWILYINPDSSLGIVAVFQIGIVFLVNIIIAIIIYFVKKYYTLFFIANAFISTIIVSFLFYLITERNMKTPEDNWIFYINNKEYNINYKFIRKRALYFITTRDSMKLLNNDSGVVYIRNDTVYFMSVDSCQYYIYGDTLYNFENIEKIKVEKIY